MLSPLLLMLACCLHHRFHFRHLFRPALHRKLPAGWLEDNHLGCTAARGNSHGGRKQLFVCYFGGGGKVKLILPQCVTKQGPPGWQWYTNQYWYMLHASFSLFNQYFIMLHETWHVCFPFFVSPRFLYSLSPNPKAIGGRKAKSS